MQILNLIEAHIVRKENSKVEFLLMKRSPNEKYPNIWQMVTGKIHNDETAYQAAIREIQEETGINTNSIFVVPHLNFFYNHESDENITIPVFVTLVNSNTEIKLSKEHTEFKWVTFKEAKKLLAWPGQKKSAKVIKDFFENKYSTLNFIEIEL